MIWFLREGSITPLISSEATKLQQSQVPLAGVLALQHFQDNRHVALSVRTGDGIPSGPGEDVWE